MVLRAKDGPSLVFPFKSSSKAEDCTPALLPCHAMALPLLQQPKSSSLAMLLQTPVPVECHNPGPPTRKLAHHQPHSLNLTSFFPHLPVRTHCRFTAARSSCSSLFSSRSGPTASTESHTHLNSPPASHSLTHWENTFFPFFSHFQRTLGLCESCHRQFSLQLLFRTDKEAGASARVHRRDAGGTDVPTAWDCLKSPCETTSSCCFA